MQRPKKRDQNEDTLTLGYCLPKKLVILFSHCFIERPCAKVGPPPSHSYRNYYYPQKSAVCKLTNWDYDKDRNRADFNFLQMSHKSYSPSLMKIALILPIFFLREAEVKMNRSFIKTGRTNAGGLGHAFLGILYVPIQDLAGSAPASLEQAPDYIIGPRDELQVFVWQKPGFVSHCSGPSPMVRCPQPLIGDVVAAQKTPDETEQGKLPRN